jgi:GT2 family glycosyltransferase
MIANSVTVLVMSYDHWELTHQLLFDLYVHCRKDIQRVCLVDNGSTDIAALKGAEWWTGNGMLPFANIRISKNIGFLAGVNMGMKMGDGDIRIILSNDIRIYGNFVPSVVQAIMDNPKTIVGNRMLDKDTGWNKFGDQIFPYLEGWMLGMSMDAWIDIGGFDERFCPSDYEDVDFSTAAVAKGYRLHSLETSNIVHLGAQTIKYSPEREAQTKINKKKFEAKWAA